MFFSKPNESKEEPKKEKTFYYRTWLDNLQNQYATTGKKTHEKDISTLMEKESEYHTEMLKGGAYSDDKNKSNARQDEYEKKMQEAVFKAFNNAMTANSYYKNIQQKYEDILKKGNLTDDQVKQSLRRIFITDVLNPEKEKGDHSFFRALAVRLKAMGHSEFIKDSKSAIKFPGVIDYSSPLQQLKETYSGDHARDIVELIKIENDPDKTEKDLVDAIRRQFVQTMNEHYKKHPKDLEPYTKQHTAPKPIDGPGGLIEYYIEKSDNALNKKPKDYKYPRGLGLMLQAESMKGFNSVMTRERIEQEKENAPRNKL